MKISELAARAGVATSAIRFYESARLLPKASRGANGYRSYDETALERITFIQTGQKLGFTLDAIRGVIALECEALQLELMKSFDARLQDIDAMMTTLAAQRLALLETRQELKSMQGMRDAAAFCTASQLKSSPQDRLSREAAYRRRPAAAT